MPPPPAPAAASSVPGTTDKMPVLFVNPNHFQNIAAAVKNTAIFSKRLITEVTDSPATVPHVCQQAEQAAFLTVVAVVEYEKSFIREQKEKKARQDAKGKKKKKKGGEEEKEGKNEEEKRVELMAKTAEELQKAVIGGTKVASQLVGVGKEEEEAHTYFQRVQLAISEKVNLLLELVSIIHQSKLVLNQKDAIKAPVQTESEAKGFDMAEIRTRKGLQFIFSLAKRVSEMITKLPHEQATMSAEDILKIAVDRERCISLLVNLARKFARSRCDSLSQQAIFDAASRTRASGTALFSAQKEVVGKKNPPKQEQSIFEQRGKEFSDELIGLLTALTKVKGSGGEGKSTQDIWEEDRQLGKNIIIENKEIKAATLNQMVIRITDPETSDVEFRKAFISTFQSFVSPDLLFAKLVQRYNVPRRKFKNMEASEWNKKIVVPLQKRVQDIFGRWIDEHFTDFNYGMVKKLNEFVDGSLRSDGYNDQAEKILKKIQKHIEKSQQGGEIERPLKAGVKVNQTLMDVDEMELARQLTLHEFWVYQRIAPIELLNLAWSSAKLRHRAPNVMKMIDRANSISAWVTHILLGEKGLKMRARYFAKFVKVGQHCFDMRNYNTLLAILASLNSAAIKRLKFTKEEAGSKVKAMLEDLSKKMSPDMSYKSIRDILRSGTPPALPYLGVFLTDLTFIEEGNPDKLGGLINFKKRLYVYGVLTEIQNFQRVSFDFETNEKLQMCLENLEFKELDSKVQFNKSLALEGRGQQKQDLVQ